MTASFEKAAPIPADVRHLAMLATNKIADSPPLGSRREEIIARAIMQDRADRASQEERIREDERDRLYALSIQLGTSAPQMWLHSLGAMHPSARARLRGDAS